MATSLRSAARAAVGADGLVLVADGECCGVVTVGGLLDALAADEDPITRLPRSGALRDWLAEQLSYGREVSVVFLDLDGFGEINKAYGHTEGDAVLARAAQAITGTCKEGDFPARFGGDEFAIGTLRPRAGAESLAEHVQDSLRAVGLSAPTGVSGGRRDSIREGENVAATVEELLRLASLACLEKK
ncbi:MAG: GGDEF domain-containing protein [Fimbriimonadales bacterium]